MQRWLSYLAVVSNALILVSGLTSAQPTLACSCIRITPQMAEQRADVVFTGQVIWRQLATPNRDRPPVAVWTFLVDQVSKGKAPRRVEVYSSRSTASCGAYFRMGAYYRVYAQRDRQKLSTSLCAGNATVTKEKQQPN